MGGDAGQTPVPHFVALQALAETGGGAQLHAACASGDRPASALRHRLGSTGFFARGRRRGCGTCTAPPRRHVAAPSPGMRAARRLAGAAPSIGRRSPTTRVHLLDDGGWCPCPRACRESCYIGGDGLARGYCGRPELTAERFVPDPAGGAGRAAVPDRRPGALFRRTASLEFLGPHRPPGQDPRLPHRAGRDRGGAGGAPGGARGGGASVRGGRRRGGAGGAPAGGLRRAAAGAAAPDAARAARLPRRAPASTYMVPVTVTFLRELPRTPSGKLDRQELPAPDGARTAQRQELVLPRTASSRRWPASGRSCWASTASASTTTSSTSAATRCSACA